MKKEKKERGWKKMDCYSFRERKPRVTTAVAVVGFCYGWMWFSQVIGMDKESTPAVDHRRVEEHGLECAGSLLGAKEVSKHSPATVSSWLVLW